MLIQSFGLFWEREDVLWRPGQGKPRHMLGRRNRNRGTLWVANLWQQKGLYVLYSNTGPYYVGIAPTMLGRRLAQHTWDSHARNWMRFSWFGFHPLTNDPWRLSLPITSKKPRAGVSPNALIKDMEALLIKSMGTYNLNNMNFSDAKEWEQVGWWEAEEWLRKIK